MRTYSTRKRILDWTPRVALYDGLPRAIAYFRDSGGGALRASIAASSGPLPTVR